MTIKLEPGWQRLADAMSRAEARMWEAAKPKPKTLWSETRLAPDAKRGAVSPIGGQAVSTQPRRVR